MQEQKPSNLREVLRHLPRLVSPEIEEALRAAGLEVRKRDTAALSWRVLGGAAGKLKAASTQTPTPVR